MSTTIRFPPLRDKIDGLSVNELADRFDTPTFVYDASTIVKRLHELDDWDVVRYAEKACSNLAILDLLRREGALVDTVSYGEMRRAAAAGFEPTSEPPPIVYTADVFDDRALDYVVENDVHCNCGSPDMIDQLGRRAPGRGISLRVNPGFGHGHSRKTNTGGDHSKHGIWHEQIEECLKRAAQHGLNVTGLHMHIGSGTDLEHLSRVAGAMEQVALAAGPTVRSVSAGGGLPVAYGEEEEHVDLAGYFACWDSARKRLQDAFGHAVRLEIEPGRYIVAESGYLVARIRAVKTMGENRFYLLDAGFNNLARPILYGAYHPMSIVPASGETSERPLCDVVVGGPLCESGDIFTQGEGGFVQSRSLPEAKVGELVVIGCAGAYGFVMGSNYNSHPLAAEVLIVEGEPHLVRRRQEFEDLIRGETIPDYGER